ncbi:MAG: ribonuclease E/G, partial [Gammaproteobacteria bacterium]
SGDKPRKRPNDMKRGQPQRRRRNRRPDTETAVTAQAGTTENTVEALETAVETPVVEAVSTAVAGVSIVPTAQTPESASAEIVSEKALPADEEVQAVSDVAEVTQTEEAAAVAEVAEVTEVPEVAEVAEVAEEETPAPVEPEPVPAAQEEAIEEAGSTNGITADGRACNDPRVNAQPVSVVEITTTHPVLFGDSPALPVTPSGHTVPRASNDPRGPLQEPDMAEATG